MSKLTTDKYFSLRVTDGDCEHIGTILLPENTDNALNAHTRLTVKLADACMQHYDAVSITELIFNSDILTTAQSVDVVVTVGTPEFDDEGEDITEYSTHHLELTKSWIY